MGRGDGDEDGCYRRRSKRHCSESSRVDTSRVPAADICDVDDDMGINEEDDDVYEYDYSYDDDDAAGGYVEEEETKDDESPAAASYTNKGYTVLTEDRILERQQEATADVAEVLSIPSSFAVLLLRHFKWRTSRVKEEWFSDDRRVRYAVGLPPDGAPAVAMARSRRRKRFPCGVCFGNFGAAKMRSAGCSHFYCDACWCGYIHTAVGDGPQCLSLRCPEPACSAAVAQELVDAVAGADDKARYARFALRSFVEESGGVVKWCPSPGCTRAVELGGGDDARDVFCECRHGFCWSCGEEAHRPVSCDTVRAWLAKNASDAETANWVLAMLRNWRPQS
ncbi:unnamed protein product [Urochloa humidicola]